MTLTLRQLITMEDAWLLDRWDHTAMVVASIHNLTSLVANALSKGSKAKPVRFEDVHPFRKAKPTGMRLTVQNFQMLKRIASSSRRK